MKKIYLLLMFVFFFSLVSSADPYLGVFQEGNEIYFKQGARINGTLADLCNISSIEYPNSTLMVSNVEMTKGNAEFNYTIAGSNTANAFGRYKINGFCNYGSDVSVPFTVYFDVNYIGNILTLEQTLVYIISLIFLVGMQLGLFFILIRLPNGDHRNDDGKIIQINQLKHLRTVLWNVIWGIGIIIMFVLSNITLAYLNNPMMADIFFNSFTIMMWISIVGIPVYFIVIFHRFMTDKELQRLIDRGVDLGGKGL